MFDHRGKILRILPNRVWRTYSGGRQLDFIEGKSNPVDGPFPEDWIGSTVRATNPEPALPDEGLARVMLNGNKTLLADLVASDAEYFFGAQHIANFGINPMVLVKYLDSAVRLPFQVHPTADFSRCRLNAGSGKTEGYYILNTRPEITDPFIYMGFQRPPSREELRRMIVEQDIRTMEACFDRIPVKPGDVFVVPGGLPHAIGGGILMVEVMEPTDFVARVEFNGAGRVIPESARFMGRDMDFALDMFSFEPLPAETVQSRWRCVPRIVETGNGWRRESLIDERTTNCFTVLKTTVNGRARWRARGFTILLLVEGRCTITIASDRVDLNQFDRILIPDGLEGLEIIADSTAVLLECRPPSPQNLQTKQPL
jgi:mannose-6-phosphate isomerase